ncbi:hypothetical protein AAF712_013514 [Marasmius tenuissimus]|uniref:Uncharacterized protein n=1 Tax=Marasmius tenuissimus TaxID=585030 RepID=A0ABR2ZG20_9AGAR
MNFNNFGPEALGQIVAAFLQSQVAAPLVTNTVNSDHSLSTNTPAPSQFSGTSGPSQPNNSPAVTSPSPFSAALLAQLTQAQPAASTNAMAGPSQIPSGVSSTPTAVQGSQPIAPYTSVNMLNAVANSTPLQSRDGRPRVTTQAGFPSIDLIRNANNARLDHAAVSIPPKRPGPRGKAKKPPTLIEQQQKLTLNDCLRVTEDERMILNLAINVYPPQPPGHTLTAFGLPRYLVKYTRHQDSFNTVLNRLHLYHEFHDLDVKTTVMEVLATVVEVLREYGYNLDPPHMAGPSAFQPHEQLPLQLLAYTNRGRPNGVNKTWKLATGSFSASCTLEDLLADKDYAHPKLSITPRGFFELNTIVRRCHYPLSIHKSLAELGLQEDDAIKTHCCIPKRVYTIFRDDAEAGSGEVMVTEQDLENDCGNEGDDEDDEEEEAVAQTLLNRPALTLRTPTHTPPVSSIGRSAATSRNVSTASSSSDGSRGPPPTRSVSAASGSSENGSSTSVLPVNNAPQSRRVPTVLWSSPWHEKKEPSLGTIYKFERTGRFFEIVSETYTSSHEGVPPPVLQVKGTDYVELASRLKGVIVECLVSGDFTRLLTLDRTFEIVNAAGETVSSGIGVEREAVQTLAHGYLSRRASTFFLPQGPQFSMLAAVNGPSARWMSNDQKMDWGILGTLVALSLIYGLGTEPLNPLALIFYLNDCHVACLHSDLVSRWFPELHGTLKAWASLGHEDDVRQFASHFSSYHECDVSSLRYRSPEQHKALGWEMLHNAVLGQRGIDHPAVTFFLKGFRMPCDKGYSFPEIARSYQGGSEEFVSSVYDSYIHHYSSLRLDYQSLLKDESTTKLNRAIQDNPSFSAASFQDLFRGFLEGSGYPSLELMNGVKGRLSPVISLDEIHQDTFRMRMFCWAATGGTLCFDGWHSHQGGVILIEDDDEEYRAWPYRRSFRSCLREMRIPASFLLHLLSIDYVTAASTFSGDEGAASSATPSSSQSSNEGLALTVKEAVEHWLLASVLDNVGESNLV